jgi:hypothetical protein
MNANQHPVFTDEYICSLACWGCKKKSKTNRPLQFNNKDGTPAFVVKGEPCVMCAPCLSKLMNKK